MVLKLKKMYIWYLESHIHLEGLCLKKKEFSSLDLLKKLIMAHQPKHQNSFLNEKKISKNKIGKGKDEISRWKKNYVV